jgi:PAS domain-containing protein
VLDYKTLGLLPTCLQPNSKQSHQETRTCFVNTTCGERRLGVTDDIVTRLRERQRELEFWWPDDDPPLTWVGEAADEIQRLRAELEQLRYEMERLSVALDDISHLTTDRQVQHRINEAHRG